MPDLDEQGKVEDDAAENDPPEKSASEDDAVEGEGAEKNVAEGDAAEEATPPEKPAPEVTIKVSADKMAVTVACTVSPDELDTLEEAMQKKMASMNLCEEARQIDLDAWLRAEAAKNEGGKIAGAVLFEGRQPVPPRDGYVEWKGDFFKKGFYVDPKTGMTDYRRQTAQTTVRADQLLAAAIAPVEGEEGLDVFGKRIKVKKGRKAKIKLGKNVRHEEDDSFYAALDGRIRWRADTLAVDEVFTVAGDVGLETGHIDHPGALVVQGDILEGSIIKTLGNIEVMGVVEPSDIEAGGNLVVHGGLTGKGTHTISVGGGVHARFILDAHIEAGEDVVADKEILQSKIWTRGAVAVPRGRIVGGEIMALGGVQVDEAGSDADVKTHITLGEDFMLPEKLEEHGAKLAKLEKGLAKIRTAVTPLLKHVDSLPKERMAAVKKLAAQMKEMGKEIEELHQEIDDIRAESTERAKFRAVVNKLIHPETTFTIRADSLRVREPEKGPVQVTLQKGLVHIYPMTSAPTADESPPS